MEASVKAGLWVFLWLLPRHVDLEFEGQKGWVKIGRVWIFHKPSQVLRGKGCKTRMAHFHPGPLLYIPCPLLGWMRENGKEDQEAGRMLWSCTWKLNLELKALKVWPSPTFLFLIDNGLECSGSSWPPHAEREHTFIKAKNDLFSLPGKLKWMKRLLGRKVNFSDLPSYEQFQMK